MSKSRKVVLGTVAVDSGMVVIMDPARVGSSWIRPENVTPAAVVFWGVDAPGMVPLIEAEFPKAVVAPQDGMPHSYLATLPPGQEHLYDQLAEFIQHQAKGNGWRVVSAVSRSDSYSQCGEICESANLGGALRFIAGHEGLGVAARAGFGDGEYEVVATLKDMGPDEGEVLTKLEITFVK